MLFYSAFIHTLFQLDGAWLSQSTITDFETLPHQMQKTTKVDFEKKKKCNWFLNQSFLWLTQWLGRSVENVNTFVYNNPVTGTIVLYREDRANLTMKIHCRYSNI